MTILPLTVAVPVLAAALMTAAGVHLDRLKAQVAGIGATLGSLALLCVVLARVSSGTDVYWFGGWEPRHGIPLGISFTVDAIGAGLAVLIAALMLAAFVVMWRYSDTAPPHLQALMLLFLAGMVGFCLSGDLFDMFVFFELMSVAAFALTGFKVEEQEAVEGSLNFAITNTVGSFLILLGIGLVYGRTGALNLAAIGHSLSGHDGLVIVAFALLVTGFLVKAAVVPFHFWLADAYAVAPTAVCLLFAGAMSELGIYAVARIWFDGFAPALGNHADALRTVLIVAGSGTALVGGAMSFAQDHLKRMLAFATISYVGLFVIGLGVLSADGVSGAALYVLADGLGKAALFAAVGIVHHRRRSLSALRLCGQCRGLWWTGALFVGGALSFAAIPPFGTFFAKSVIEDGLVKVGFGWAIAVLVTSSALTTGAVLRVAGRVFLGWGASDEKDPYASVDETTGEEEVGEEVTPASMMVPAAALLVGALALGLIPGMVEAMEQAATRFMDGTAYAAATLHGVAPAPMPSPPPYSAAWTAYLYSGLTLAGGVALAAFALRVHDFSSRLARWPADAASAVLAPVRRLHSGHVGDYVTWLLVGLAFLGGAFAIGFQ